MKLKIGMIVNYKPTAYEMGIMKEKQSVCNIKENLPAVVVSIDEENYLVNLKVLLDGKGDIWAKDVVQGDEVGQWEWFEFEEAEETAFLDEINALIVKLAQQKNELEELSKNVNIDIVNLQERALSFSEAIEAAKAFTGEVNAAAIPVKAVVITAKDAKKV